MPRECKNSPDIFYYICGRLTTTDQRTAITNFVKSAYFAYFGCKLGDQDKELLGQQGGYMKYPCFL